MLEAFRRWGRSEQEKAYELAPKLRSAFISLRDRGVDNPNIFQLGNELQNTAQNKHFLQSPNLETISLSLGYLIQEGKVASISLTPDNKHGFLNEGYQWIEPQPSAT